MKIAIIGAGSIVLPGTSIGAGAIVGAGSVVTKNIPDGMVFAGNPAREICTVQAFLSKHSRQLQSSPCYDESYTLRKNITQERKLQQKRDLENGVGYVV